MALGDGKSLLSGLGVAPFTPLPLSAPPSDLVNINMEDIHRHISDAINMDQMHALMQAQANQGHWGIANANAPTAAQQARAPTERDKIVALSAKARQQFVDRMGGVRNTFNVAQGDCIYTHVVGDRCILFYYLDGKVGHVEEPTDVFPSDTLITQFRLIINS